MNCKETTRLDMPDIGFDDIEDGTSVMQPHWPLPPAPIPTDTRRDWVSEGCVCVALLSLATTIISLILLKGK